MDTNQENVFLKIEILSRRTRFKFQHEISRLALGPRKGSSSRLPGTLRLTLYMSLEVMTAQPKH